MPATLVSVNVARIEVLEHNGKSVRTGILKKPVRGPVRVGPLGLEGDEQADVKHHGGEQMALYAYTVANYNHWRDYLGRDLPPGIFGENLTVDGLDESDVSIGDRFRIGDEVEVEVSIPRAPCATFAMVMQDTKFGKEFLASGRVGFYMRVQRGGVVNAGDAWERTYAEPSRLTVAEISHTAHFALTDRAALERGLGVGALSPKWQERLRTALAKL
jgi:MOSC domain-containing protein YiiM